MGASQAEEKAYHEWCLSICRKRSISPRTMDAP